MIISVRNQSGLERLNGKKVNNIGTKDCETYRSREKYPKPMPWASNIPVKKVASQVACCCLGSRGKQDSTVSDG